MNQDQRKVSNTRNIITAVVSVIALIVIGLIYLLKKNVLMHKLLGTDGQLIALFLALVALIILSFSIAKCYSVSKINKRLKNLPYYFDYEKELSIYKVIGTKKKSKDNAQRYLIYSDWKEHLHKKYKEQINYENFYRFVNQSIRAKKEEKDLIQSLVIPLEITIISVYFNINNELDYNECIISLILLVGFFVIYFTRQVIKINWEINFYDDFIEVMFPDMKKNE